MKSISAVVNNRELSTLILVGGFLLFAIWNRSTRATFPSLAKQLFASKITPVLALFIGVVVAAVSIANRLNLWSWRLAAATVLWFLSVGFVWFINLGDAGKAPDFFKRRFLDTLGVTAFLEFFINAQVLPLPIEMVGQIFLLFVVLLNAVASGDERYRPVATITSVVLSIASLALLTYSLAHMVTEWDTLDKRELANEFLMPIWLAGVSIPILYLAALYMGYETLFTRLTPSAGEAKVVLRARVGIVLGLRGGLVDIDQFRGASARDAARAHSVSEARDAVTRFKQTRAEDLAARAAARQALIDNAGREGVDQVGRVLDRREFAETKEALIWLATCQMGRFRNGDPPGSYRTELLPVLGDSHDFETPEPITMKARADGQAWYAYRRTPSGHVLGIGASEAPPSQWFYDAPAPPCGFPSGASKGWSDLMSPDRPEWGREAEH